MIDKAVSKAPDYKNIKWVIDRDSDYGIINARQTYHVFCGSNYSINNYDITIQSLGFGGQLADCSTTPEYSSNKVYFLPVNESMPLTGVLYKISGEGPNEIRFNSWESAGLSVTETDLNKTKNRLLGSGINNTNIVLDRKNERLIILGEAVAYAGSGKHHKNYWKTWASTNRSIDISVVNRSLMTSYESYNAVTFTGDPTHPDWMRSYYQGKIADAVSSIAFGSLNYSKSFSGATGTVAEPYSGGVSIMYNLMPAYANGMTLAESAMSSWYSLTISNRGNKGIAIGDPLMRITDYKHGIGMLCNNDDDCLTELCNNDKNQTKRCHVNKSNCVNGAFEGDFDNFETNNNMFSCFDSTHKIQCIDGEWQPLVYCGDGKLCANGICKLDKGQECIQDGECIGYCDYDIGGIKRCHDNKYNCVINQIGEETLSCSTHCFDSTREIRCIGAEWQNPVSCKDGCKDTECVKEYSKSFSFSLVQGKFNFVSLPLNPHSNKIIDLFKDKLIGGQNHATSDIIHRWNNSQQTYGTYWKNSLNMWVKVIPIIETQDEINLGKGFIIVVKENHPSQEITIYGDEINSPIPVNIKGSRSLIGIPYCYNYYSASKVLNEVNSLDENCTSIVRWDIDQELNEYWYINNTGIDFGITNYEAYWISCNESTDVIWTPSCEQEQTTSSGGGGGGSTTKPQCNDRRDNDRDDLIDLNDPGCEDRNDDDESDPLECKERWVCSNWEPKVCPENEMQTRICQEVNNCNTEEQKPTENKKCEYFSPIREEEPKQISPIYENFPKQFIKTNIILTTFLLVILAGIGFVFYEQKRSQNILEQEKQQTKLEDPSLKRLEEYVHNCLAKGLDKEKVKNVILEEGWNRKIVDNVFRKIGE